MKMKILAAGLLLSVTQVANAGFFDFLFGGKEKAPAVEAQTEAAAETQTTSTLATAASMAEGVLPLLTQQLGVTERQAEGGMGSLMQMAKSALSEGEFAQLSSGVPNMDTLLAAAPVLTGEGGSGAMSDLLSSATGAASSLAGIAQLRQQFESLGLSPDMIAQFANIAISYFSQSGADTGALLQKGLGAILGQ